MFSLSPSASSLASLFNLPLPPGLTPDLTPPSLPGFSTVAGHRLLSTFSTYFQIRDDYCNLWDTKYKENKSYCEDLTEGKFSWVIIQGILKGEYSAKPTGVDSF